MSLLQSSSHREQHHGVEGVQPGSMSSTDPHHRMAEADQHRMIHAHPGADGNGGGGGGDDLIEPEEELLLKWDDHLKSFFELAEDLCHR